MAASPKPPAHRWNFYRAGGVDQVRLDTGADVLSLDQLDQKLWVALSCPVQGLEFDARTLELLDSDGDAHVRPPEILAAVRWLRQVLKNADGLAAGRDGLALADLRTDTEEGKTVLAAAKNILANLGKDKDGVITVADATAKLQALGLVVERLELLGEALRVGGRYEDAVHAVRDDVRVPGDVRGDHGRAGGERLGQDHPEALTRERWCAQHVGPVEPGPELAVVNPPERGDAILDRRIGHVAVDVVGARADDGQASGHVLDERLERLNQHRQALAAAPTSACRRALCHRNP